MYVVAPESFENTSESLREGVVDSEDGPIRRTVDVDVLADEEQLVSRTKFLSILHTADCCLT